MEVRHEKGVASPALETPWSAANCAENKRHTYTVELPSISMRSCCGQYLNLYFDLKRTVV